MCCVRHHEFDQHVLNSLFQGYIVTARNNATPIRAIGWYCQKCNSNFIKPVSIHWICWFLRLIIVVIVERRIQSQVHTTFFTLASSMNTSSLWKRALWEAVTSMAQNFTVQNPNVVVTKKGATCVAAIFWNLLSLWIILQKWQIMCWLENYD